MFIDVDGEEKQARVCRSDLHITSGAAENRIRYRARLPAENAGTDDAKVRETTRRNLQIREGC